MKNAYHCNTMIEWLMKQSLCSVDSLFKISDPLHEKEDRYSCRGSNSIKIILLPWKQWPTKKTIICTQSANPFILVKTFYSEGVLCAGKQSGSHLPCINGRKLYQVSPSPLLYVQSANIPISLKTMQSIHILHLHAKKP